MSFLILVVGLIILLVLSWARPHVALSICCLVPVFSQSFDALQSLTGYLGVPVLMTVALLRAWKTLPEEFKSRFGGRGVWLRIAVVWGIWIAISGVLNGRGTGTPVRESIGFAAPLIWGLLFGRHPVARKMWFSGVTFASALNFLSSYDPGGLFGFLPKGDVTFYEGVFRQNSITYIHTTGLLAAYAFLTALGYALERKVRAKNVANLSALALLLAVAAFSGYLLIVSFSRGAILGIAVAFGLGVVSLPRYRNPRSLMGAIVMLLLAYIVAGTSFSTLADSDFAGATVETFYQGFAPSSASNQFRARAAAEAIDILAGSPWFGVGTIWAFDIGLLAPHQLPLSVAQAFGAPAGLVLSIMLTWGLLLSLLELGSSAVGKGTGGGRPAAWLFASLLVVTVASSMSNGAIAVGFGFQWWVIGACLAGSGSDALAGGTRQVIGPRTTSLVRMSGVLGQ